MRNPATPLPARFPATEIGLMTREEFLRSRNKQQKYHGDEAYDYDIEDLNLDLYSFGFNQEHRGPYWSTHRPFGQGEGLAVQRDGKWVAIIKGPTMYLEHPLRQRDVDTGIAWTAHEPARQEIRRQLDQVEEVVIVKYAVDYLDKLVDRKSKNNKKFPHLLQNIRLGDEHLAIRAETKPKLDAQTHIVAVRDDGTIVGTAQDEWGATLIAVAQEYRGKGLGRVLGEIWYDLNPNSVSGGFTPSGEANALKIWEGRVRDFQANGWYSQMVREGRMSPARARDIASGLGSRRRPGPLAGLRPKTKGAQPDLLFYVDDPTFVIYDRRFLQDPDSDYIYAYGFFRCSQPVGCFLFRIDYEKPYRKMATAIALQMAYDQNDPVYIGRGYGDFLELDGIPELAQDGDYVQLQVPLLDLRALSAEERRLRGRLDRFGELHSQILEGAESKWR